MIYISSNNQNMIIRIIILIKRNKKQKIISNKNEKNKKILMKNDKPKSIKNKKIPKFQILSNKNIKTLKNKRKFVKELIFPK